MKVSLVINVKMPAIVGIFIFVSRAIFMLSWVEYNKKFYNLGAWSLNSFGFLHDEAFYLSRLCMCAGCSKSSRGVHHIVHFFMLWLICVWSAYYTTMSWPLWTYCMLWIRGWWGRVFSDNAHNWYYVNCRSSKIKSWSVF